MTGIKTIYENTITEPIVRTIKKLKKGFVVLLNNKKYICILCDEKYASLCRYKIMNNKSVEIDFKDCMIVHNESWAINDWKLITENALN